MSISKLWWEIDKQVVQEIVHSFGFFVQPQMSLLLSHPVCSIQLSTILQYATYRANSADIHQIANSCLGQEYGLHRIYLYGILNLVHHENFAS